jgi:hypothetical protein
MEIKEYLFYTLYSDGRIWSNKTNKFLKPRIRTKDGYVSVCISGNVTKYLHRLIGEAFIPNPLNLPQVNHKNGNKQDCSVLNLEWCDQSHNIKHGFKTGLFKSLSQEIKDLIKSEVGSQRAIAKKYGISQSWVSILKKNLKKIRR